MTLTDIREAKATKVAEARSLLATENLNAEGKAKFDALKGEIEALEKDEARAQFVEDIERRSKGQPVDKGHAKLEAQVNVLDVIRSQMEGRSLAGAAAEYSAEAERRSGRKPEGAFIPLAALETRASTTTSAAQIVPTDYRPDQFIEPFRNSLLARRLGVRVLSGLSGNVSIPKYGTGLTTGWVAENSALSTSDMTFASPVTLTPKHAGGITELSRQLIMQASPDIEQLVRDDLSFMIAQAIDSALIAGTGASNQPTGVLTVSGTQSGSLATPTWAGVLELIEKTELVNATAVNWLTSPKVKTVLASTLKASSAGSSYLYDAGQMAGLPLFATNQVPVDAEAGTLILGDWSQVFLGIWSELDILVNPYAETAYSKGNTLVRAMATVDVANRHPESFVIADDVAI